MIYREKELESLKQAYQTMQEMGSMQLRFICGEAGSGKTVLANMFLDEVSETAGNTLFVSTYCNIRSDYSIPYQPFKELLKQLLQDIKNEERVPIGEKTKKEKVKDALLFSAKMICEHAPDLIGNFVPGAAILGVIGQTMLKEKSKEESGIIEESKIIEQYADAIRAISERYKLVLFIDNLQWIDNPSVNLLFQLIMALQSSPVMIIGNYRSIDISSDSSHPMTRLLTEIKINKGNVFIDLDTIAKEEKEDFMNALLDSESNIYDTLFRKTLLRRTNGNPLFVNELINLLKETGMVIRNNDGIWMNNADLVWNLYPVRIEGIIQERIGKLEDSLIETLSHASVQGHSFISQVLSRTIGEPERDTLMTLSKKLQKQHQLVFEGDCTRANHGMVSRFNFSNYIFQQYLYQELSMSERIMLHSDIAGILEELFKNSMDEVVGDIARHYEMSGEYEKAIRYIKITVENMMRVCAYEEASILIRKGIGFLETIPETVEWEKEKLYFMVQLCICYRSIKGFGNAEVESLLEQTKDLSKKLRVFDYIEVVLSGLWTIKLSKLQLDDCLQLALKNMNAALRHGNRQVKLMALLSLGTSYFWLGRLKDAEESFTYFFGELKQIPGEDSDYNDNVQLNTLVALMYTMLIAQQKRNSATASEIESKIIDLLSRNENKYYQVVGCRALTWYYYFSGEKIKSRSFSEKMIEISEKHQFHFYKNIGILFTGASFIGEDNLMAENLIKKGYQRLLDLSRTDITTLHSVYAHMLGSCYQNSNQREMAISFLEKEIALSEAKNENMYISQLKDLLT